MMDDLVKRLLEVTNWDEAEDECKEAAARIEELELGSCRYNCRKRKESCQSFAYYVCKNRKSLMTPTAKALDDMYAEWQKHEKDN